MARQKLDVCIGESGIHVGAVIFEAQGNREFSSFQYAGSWLEHPAAFPIAPSLPLGSNTLFFRREGDRGSALPPPIADTTPDSWGRNIIRRDSKNSRKGTEPLNELDFLLAVDDFRRLGALRFKEPGEKARFLSASPEGRHNVPPLLKLGELGLSIASLERSEPMTAQALRRLRQVGSALGGARPKCSVIDNNGSLLIAKFTSRNDRENVEAMEVTTLKLAAMCGLDAPEVRIDYSDDLPVALIKRFDRGRGRRPYISAQTFLDAPDAESGTYTDLVDTMRAHSDDPVTDIRLLFERVAFTILVSNVDDHLKNHGFLHAQRGKWRLSPIFDVNPSPDRHRELKTHISPISGAEASIETLLDHAVLFDRDPDEAVSLIARMAATIVNSWEQLARSNGMSTADISHYRPAFEHADMERALSLPKPTLELARDNRRGRRP